MTPTTPTMGKVVIPKFKVVHISGTVCRPMDDTS